MKKRRRYDKWVKHKIFIADPNLSSYLPETALLNEESFWRLLDKHGAVIVKPCIGRMGKGVMQVTSMGEEEYEVRHENKYEWMNGKSAVYTYVKSIVRQKKYVVQEKIPLATIKDSPFDLRVMVQRKSKKSNQWEVTGKLAKVASKRYFITNVARKLLTYEEAMEQASIDPGRSSAEIEQEIERISLMTAARLRKYRTTRIGVDIAIVQNGTIKMIEANLKPSVSMFSLLRDKTMYETIKHYRKKPS